MSICTYSDAVLYSLSFQSGDTPLYIAVKNWHTQIAELLLSKGAYSDVKVAKLADVNSRLHKAVVNGHTQVVELLLSRGADANCEGSVSICTYSNAVLYSLSL